MSNDWGRLGAPMIQPTKDELRQIISDQQDALAEERAEVISLNSEVSALKKKLEIAQRLLGQQLIETEVRRDVEQRLLTQQMNGAA
jgi:hypothetical protein